MAFTSLAGFAIGALAPFFIDDLDLSRLELGLLVSIVFAVASVLSVVVGGVVDRLGARRLLGASMLVGAASLGAFALAPGYPWLVLAAVVGGVAMASGNPVTNKLVVVHVPAGRRGTIMGVKQSGVQAGAFLAGLLLPVLAALLGWRWALGVAALAAAAAATLSLVVPPNPPAPAGEALRPEPGDRGAPIAWLVLYAFLMGVGLAVVVAYLPLYAHERLGFSEQAAGAVASVVGLSAGLFGVVWSRSSHRFRRLSTPLALIAALSVPSLLLLAAAPALAPWLLWPAAAACGATAFSWNATGMLAVVTAVGSRRAGHASGQVLLGFYAGLSVAPFAFGWSVDRLDTYAPGWIAVAVCFGLAALVSRRA